MSTRILLATAALTMTVAVAARAGQHEGHQGAAASPDSAQTALCRQAQAGVSATIDAALKRLDEAKQTNSMSGMRAANDELQTALLDVRRQLAPCAEMQAAADGNAGHTMPNAPSAPAAAPAPDAHAGHTASVPAPAAPSNDRGPSVSGVRIAVRAIPDPARTSAENRFEVTVADGQGRPVEGADVSLLFVMPAMPAMKMPEMRNEIRLMRAGNGRYAGSGRLMMAGQWNVTAIVKLDGKTIGQQNVTITAK